MAAATIALEPRDRATLRRAVRALMDDRIETKAAAIAAGFEDEQVAHYSELLDRLEALG
jgi:hypothetical protein